MKETKARSVVSSLHVSLSNIKIDMSYSQEVNDDSNESTSD